MLNSKSKKAGFFGTLLFHLIVLLICLLTSIGYTSIEEPTGIAIAFAPYQDLTNIDNTNDKINTLEKPVSSIDNAVVAEKIIIEETETIQILNENDTINLMESNQNTEPPSISKELANALSKFNNVDDVSLTADSSQDIDNTVLTANTSPNMLDDSEDGYILSDDRQAVRKIKPNYICDEFGKVVVRVWVNREGRTIKAEPGIRGTTESASCLFEEAKNAALQTTWTPFINAPEVQIGQITYNFHKY